MPVIQDKYKILSPRASIFVMLVFFLALVSWNNPTSVRKQLSMDEWVDSVMQSLTIEQRIGQLFMVAAYSNRNEKHVKEIDELVTKYNIGGLIFFQGGPVRQAILTNKYQSTRIA